MEKYEKVYNRGNEYFDTYHVRNTTTGKYIGIIEDHARGVTKRYYVGWHFEGAFIPGAFQPGATKAFETEEEAMSYITDEYKK